MSTNNVAGKLAMWQKQWQAASNKAAQAKGRLDMLMSQLQTKYGVSTVEELREKLELAQQQHELMERKLEEKTQQFEEKYAEELAKLSR